MRKKRLFLTVLIVIVAAAAILFFTHFRQNRQDGTMLLSGNVEVTEPDIGFKIPGRVVERPVDEGDKVKKGDIIAKLDQKELQSIVAQNRAALDEALTRLAELKAGSRAQEIEQAKAGLDFQEAALERAKKDFDRAQILFKNGAIAASQFDAFKSTYETLMAQQRSVKEQLSLVREGPRREEITMAAQRVEQARAALRAAEDRLGDTVIYAPMDGVVLKKNVEPGETVAQGTPVVTIGDLAHPWIKVYVKEDKLGLIKLGQKATITTDTYRGKAYEGTVTYISSEAEFTPKTVQTHEERVKLVYGVKVSVRNVNDELKPSMPADVRIVVNRQ